MPAHPLGRNVMKLKNLGYVALMTVATTAFVLGTAGSSEAAKKKAAAAPPPVACFGPEKRVCAVKGGAKVVSQKACPVKAAKKGGKKKAKKAAKKPAKK